MRFTQAFSYLFHFFFSKRRHGTHSPFVYAYAEQVLHTCHHKVNPFSKRSLHHAQQGLLVETLAFLQPTTIEEWKGKRKKWKTKNDRATSVYPHHQLSQKEVMIIDNIADFSLNDYPVCIFLNIHQDKDSLQKWYQLIEDENVSLSLDVWHFGLLIQSESFKNKCHFNLK